MTKFNNKILVICRIVLLYGKCYNEFTEKILKRFRDGPNVIKSFTERQMW